jgi:hypothetical protein
MSINDVTGHLQHGPGPTGNFIALSLRHLVPDWLMLRVYARRRWYLCPDSFFCSLEEYIAASRAAPAADVRTYQAEVAVFESAHRKRRCEALEARAKRSAASGLDAGARSARVCIQEGARVQRPFVQSVRTYEL